jgi:O-antigen/teichoic acid export membrane protein
MLFYPILCRIFTPAEFGLLATLSSITIILAVLATGRYEKSVLIVYSLNDAANIIGLTLLLSLSILFILFLLLQLFSHHLELWFNEPGLTKWLFVCPISAYAIIVYNCYNEWCVRNKYFINLSWNKVINSSATTLSKLLFGFVKVFTNGLVIGDLLGRIISAAGCVFRALQKDKTLLFQMSFKRMQYLAKRYHEFPKIYLPGELINAISLSLPVFFIGAYFNSNEVGYYAMTMNVLSLPVSVISLAIKDVFRQRANEIYLKTGNCVEIYKRILKILIFLGALGTIILFFTLPYIFSLVLGKRWEIAGEYSQILLPMIAVEFVSTSLNGVFIIANKIKIVLYWQILFIIISSASLFLGSFIFHEIKICLICYSIGRCIAYLLDIFLSFKYSKGNMTNA